MFYSQCLLSRKGPLGGIWIAAYSFKKLKKAQVNSTDISSSVDKILQDEWDAVAYRVLAYLLLGVVRIYSKKVEYLFDDCNQVLIKIKKFVVSTKKDADVDMMRAPFYSVTLPDKFELDAFDLGILEVEDVSGSNVVSQEDITLKDCAKRDESGQFSSDMYDYEEFDLYGTNCAADYTPVKDVLSTHMLDLEMELRALSNGANSEATIEKLQENRFSQEECVDLETIYGIHAELPNQDKPYGEERKTNGEHTKTPMIELSEGVIQEEASPGKLRDSSPLREGLNLETLNLETFNGTEREPSYRVRSPTEDHQIDQEESMGPELVQPGNQISPIVSENQNVITSEADIEKLRNCAIPQEEYMDVDLVCGVKQSRELVSSIGKENHDGEPDKIDGKITVQEDPNSVSVAYPSVTIPSPLGVTTPKCMVVRTPAIKESSRISRKRKCVFDDKIVLPNELIKASLDDASDLVSKRRKVPRTTHATWSACRLRNLPHDFLEPLIPADISRELRSLLCDKKSKILKPAETVRRPEKLDLLESPSSGRSEQIEIAPETPVLRSQSMKSFASPKTPEDPDTDTLRPEPSGRMEEESSLGTGMVQASPSANVDEVPLLDGEQAGPSGSVEDVPFLKGDQEHDLNLMNEEIDFCEGVIPQTDGWSGRTRVVARYLDQHFPGGNSNQGEKKVKLLQVSEGRTRKESARLFYEILVLKTKGDVDVKQDDAYGDILIWKLPQWDQTWGDAAASETV